MNVRDRVLVKDKQGNKWIGTIININDFREPHMKYCIDLDEYEIDYVFVGENDIELLKEQNND